MTAPIPTLHPEATIPEPYDGEILRGTIGSTIHGLSVPGTDDFDLMGVRIETQAEVMGLTPAKEQIIYRSAGGSNPSRPGDVDLTVFDLRKYLRLALKGNPTVLNLLFVPGEHIHHTSIFGEELQNLAPYFVSREAGRRFLGYMRHQRERLMGVRGQKRSGKIRQDLIDAHGFDTKYAMHVIRLGHQGLELMRTGRISLPMADPLRSEIMRVREGKVTEADVLAWAESIEADLIQAVVNNDLPEHAEWSLVERWLMDVYPISWSER